ncbi:MAG: hypothetical protein AAFQ84_11965 [Pseudomonadota bacterium]
MSGAEDIVIPESSEDRLALLQTAYNHGEAIRNLTSRGTSYGVIEQYLAEHVDLAEEKSGNQSRLTFLPTVYWDITLDCEGNIAGFGQSGLQTLMSRLGIDMSGRPYLSEDE